MAKKAAKQTQPIKRFESVVTLFVDGVAMYTSREGYDRDKNLQMLRNQFEEMGLKVKTVASLWID